MTARRFVIEVKEKGEWFNLWGEDSNGVPIDFADEQEAWEELEWTFRDFDMEGIRYSRRNYRIREVK